jgi:membrane protease YdiL (CAAX protease family)
LKVRERFPAVPQPNIVIVALLAAGGLAGALGVVVLLISTFGASVPAPHLIKPFGLAALIAGLVLTTAGLGVAVFWPVLQGHASAAAGFGSHRVVLTTTAFATLLAVLVGNAVPFTAMGLAGQRNLRSSPGFLAAALSVSAVLLVVAYFRFIRPGVVSVSDFGFGRNRLAPHFFNNVGLATLATGVGGWLAVALLGRSSQLLLRQIGVEQTQLREFTWVRDLPPTDFLLILFAGAVIAPLAEEIFFRGLVFRSYLEAKGPLVAYLASSTVFALLHLNLPAFLPIMVLGLVLAGLYRLTGSLLPGVLAHTLNNGLAFLVLYAGRMD